MRSVRSRQQGLGWFGLLLVFGLIAFFAIVGVKCLPLYLNHMKVAKAIVNVSKDGELTEGQMLRNALQRYWDIEDIKYLQVKEVKIKRDQRGKFLVYDYEAREKLFYNIFVVIHFQGEEPMANVVGN